MLHPDFFAHEGLAEVSRDARLLFAALWTIADREGRLEDRPKRIKLASFPYDDDVNVVSLLDELADHPEKFVVRYQVEGQALIRIPKFLRWQKPHPHEAKSVLPGPAGESHAMSGDVITCPDTPRNVTQCPSESESDSKSETESEESFAPSRCAPPPVLHLDPDPGHPPRPDPLEGFDAFYAVYPRKKKRPDAERAWGKLKPPADLRTEIMAGLERAKRSVQWRDRTYVPYPASFLNGRQWQDEWDTTPAPSRFGGDHGGSGHRVGATTSGGAASGAGSPWDALRSQQRAAAG